MADLAHEQFLLANKHNMRQRDAVIGS